MKLKVIYTILILLCGCTNNNTTSILKKSNQILQIIDNNEEFIEIENNNKPKIFFTLDPECPLSKSYSRTINLLFRKYEDEVDFYNIFSPIVFSKMKTENFIKKYHINIPLIIDTNHILINYLDAKITPECFLVDSNLNIIYQGLIDDWVKALGSTRKKIENHYLEQSINDFLNNREIKVKKTNAIGCLIQRQ